MEMTSDDHTLQIPDEDVLSHIGIKRRSGRYPWGSGSTPYQRSVGFKRYMAEMRVKQGLRDTQIAAALTDYVNSGNHRTFIKITTADLRAGTSSSTSEIRAYNRSMAAKLKAKNMSNAAIAERMGLGSGKSAESTVRGWLKNYDRDQVDSLQATANALKEYLDNGKPFLDVGKGTHLHMGIAETKLKQALALLRDEGYNTHPIKVRQLGTDKDTNSLILTKGDVDWATARRAVNEGRVSIVAAQSDDGGLSFRKPKDAPVSVNSKQLQVRYAEEGGAKMDGVIELRRGLPDLDLGAARYAQVRIAVDDSHYLKGMAMYADDLPDGVDMRFNTNKSKGASKLDALKPMKTLKDGSIDVDNPFGAQVRPRTWVDSKGKTRTSALNIVNEEGAWDGWSDNLSSQMLSKQSLALASRQLGLTQKRAIEDLATIKSFTNPVVRKKLLEEYANSTDSAATHLKAASLPRQSTHVILPFNSMRPHEIYARGFEDGEKVVLVRYPHGGPFEIPELTVNNKSLIARRTIGAAKDAIGIHHTVAEQLSGADFDGDTVLVIPNDSRTVKTRPPLEGLRNFDAKKQYKIPDDDTTTKRMTKAGTQNEMGQISNLITDMTIHGASSEQLAKAVRHSMVVIDAEKHGLDYRQSAIDNSIAQLKAEYQGSKRGGASTIISRASSDVRVPHFKLRGHQDGGPIDPKTGALVWEPTGKMTVDKDGMPVPATKKVSRMELVSDARELTSGGVKGDSPPMEEVYAAHANLMKSLANDARLASSKEVPPKVSPAAKAVYAKEVAALNRDLQVAQRNAPLERRAQIIAGALARDRIRNSEDLDKAGIKKIRYQALDEAREMTEAKRYVIPISDRQWEAIQAGAVSPSRLSEILRHTDMERIKELATPRYKGSLTPGQLASAKQMAASGRSVAEIARELGIPRTTLAENLKNG